MGDDKSVEAAVYLHLVFVLLYAGSITTATVLRFYVAFNTSLSAQEVFTILSVVRPLVPVVVISLLAVIGFGFWAIDAAEFGHDETWLVVTYALVGYMLLVGAVAGKHDRITRQLAGEAKQTTYGADISETVSAELKARLRSPISLGLNSSVWAATVIVLAMMIFKPGVGGSDD